MYTREERFRQVFIDVDGNMRRYTPRSVAQRDKNLEVATELGWTVVDAGSKLYPFNAEKNQHNFDYVMNKCHNLMHDMLNENIRYDEDTFDYLEATAMDAEELFSLGGGIVWLDYKTLAKAKRLASLASEMRVETCIRNGRLDLIRFC